MKKGLRLLLVLGFVFTLAAQFGLAQVIITEVDPSTGMIEFHNTGDDAVDISSMFLCNRPAYTPVSGLELVSGDLVIEGHGYTVVTWSAIAATDAELALYTAPEYNNAEALVDYVAWGSAGHGREGVAVEAGLWNAGEFLEMPAEGMSLTYVGMAETPMANWSMAEPSFGMGEGM